MSEHVFQAYLGALTDRGGDMAVMADRLWAEASVLVAMGFTYDELIVHYVDWVGSVVPVAAFTE